MNEAVFSYSMIYALDDKTCGLMICLLSMCEVMGFDIYIALVRPYNAFM